jgi:hypothetical protein
MSYVIGWRPLAALQKNPGDSYGATLTFKHRGEAEQVWIGIGIAYGKSSSITGIPLLDIIDNLGHHPPFCWAMKQVSLNADYDWVTYTVDVDDKIPQDAQAGQPLDAQKFISKTQPVAGQVAPDDFGVNNWDDDVYSSPGSASGGFDLGSMISLMMVVMMMSMIMPMMGEEKPASTAAAAGKREGMAASPTPAGSAAAKTGGVVVNIAG